MHCLFRDPCQNSLPISGEVLILQVVVGVRLLSSPIKAGTRSSLSHRQHGAGTHSSTDESDGLFLGCLNVENEHIFSHIWHPRSDRTEKYRGGEGHGKVLTRKFLRMSLATSPDALSEANSPAFPINSSACDSRNRFPSLATKNPDNRGGYYTHQGTNV